jgi:glutathione S-transferase
MLEEMEAPCRIVPIDGEKGERKAPSFLTLNPMGKLPPIVHRTTGG